MARVPLILFSVLVPVSFLYDSLLSTTTALRIPSLVYLLLACHKYEFQADGFCPIREVQVNLFQKPSFLHQLTHSMTRDCSLNSPKNTSSQHVMYTNCCFCFDIQNNICTQHVVNLYFGGNSMNNLLSYCGLVDAKIRTSDKDLPV